MQIPDTTQMPTREEILSLKVGDLIAHQMFGAGSPVRVHPITRIFAAGISVKGEPYACFDFNLYPEDENSTTTCTGSLNRTPGYEVYTRKIDN